eukprot:TRINITY_DN9756_c0_g1_i1.p1 TRINITY_DN9756_c0_g1~~TRINITY_DN9756_c0_g1_i1.p1  ORF type:complete len:105 (-),score=7.12 TRINITY_DN9756_c0_g1_i1:751-1065(-)
MRDLRVRQSLYFLSSTFTSLRRVHRDREFESGHCRWEFSMQSQAMTWRIFHGGPTEGFSEQLPKHIQSSLSQQGGSSDWFALFPQVGPFQLNSQVAIFGNFAKR